MIENFISFYLPDYPTSLIYMLQRTEYRPGDYLRWYINVKNFHRLMNRGKLDYTRKAQGLLWLLRAGIFLQLVLAVILVWHGFAVSSVVQIELGIVALISYPLVWALLIVIPIILANELIVKPKQSELAEKSKKVFGSHKAVKIAVAGSYGKTSMKELLGIVLSEGKRVAITPANKNVLSSHAIFASKLKGDEDVLVIEYGEGKPGDIAKFTATTKPDIGIITGVAPAHLDQYKSLDAAAEDIFDLTDYLSNKDVYVNKDSKATANYIKSTHNTYSKNGIGKWEVKNVHLSEQGISFSLVNGARKLKLKSGLLGRHQIGPLSAVAVLGLKLGLTNEQVEAGIAKTTAFEHRMKPRLVNGAWIIDDTYNGNIEGIRAGLGLLKELPAKRKIYVTPGLVDQGPETENVHREIGKLIAEANPDLVVLMKNSVSHIIETSLMKADYKGELRIEKDPLGFYKNVDQFIAAGDLVLMQNDWPDNYR
jgi:UDP-N-acetylmuramoyl-tripeptide--D-alanyl-D-alanine ligase